MRLPRHTERPSRLLIAPRGRMAPTPDETITLDWCSDNGDSATLTPQCDDSAWQVLARRCDSAEAILLLSADAVSHFHLAAPPGLKRSEWPLLLEDVTTEAVDSFHLHPLQRGRDHLELLALPAGELTAWQAWAQHRGLTLKGWSTAFLALALPDSPASASVLDDGHHHLFKGIGEPIAGGRQAAIQWLAWPREWTLPPSWRGRRMHIANGDATAAESENLALAGSDAEQARRESLTWLVDQGLPALPFSPSATPRRPLHHLLPGQRARRLGGAIAVLILLNVALWLMAELDERGRLALADEAALAARFEGTSPPNAASLLAAREAAIDALAQRNRRLETELDRATALLEDTRWQLARLEVEGRQARLGWRYAEPPAPVVIERARQQLSALGSPQWQAGQEELLLELSLADPREAS